MDQTAPLPPTEVKTARTSSSIKIYWEKGTEKDLAGYRVYRRLGSESSVEMIGEVMAEYNIYADKDAPEKGTKVYYSVTSFDTSIPANESQPSDEAVAR
ncbi:MAG: hypothetical protein D3923_17055, partial [Candidatus Electrothrix sp. AR3]|nr:hypothetical protein [Candidatus Electrothrix sp. AR3]